MSPTQRSQRNDASDWCTRVGITPLSCEPSRMWLASPGGTWCTHSEHLYPTTTSTSTTYKRQTYYIALPSREARMSNNRLHTITMAGTRIKLHTFTVQLWQQTKCDWPQARLLATATCSETWPPYRFSTSKLYGMLQYNLEPSVYAEREKECWWYMVVWYSRMHENMMCCCVYVSSYRFFVICLISRVSCKPTKHSSISCRRMSPQVDTYLTAMCWVSAWNLMLFSYNTWNSPVIFVREIYVSDILTLYKHILYNLCVCVRFLRFCLHQ